MEKERWKEVPGYPRYEMSNLGRIKKDGKVSEINQKGKYKSRRIINGNGYKSYRVSVLVAMTFLGHKPCGHKVVVDHKDNNQHNDKLDNIQLITNRQNYNKDRSKGATSKYPGVHFNKSHNKYRAFVRINGKRKHLGFFDTEEEAYKTYKGVLDKANEKIY